MKKGVTRKSHLINIHVSTLFNHQQIYFNFSVSILHCKCIESAINNCYSTSNKLRGI